jgi:DNA-binding transcriptional LysR family regulator
LIRPDPDSPIGSELDLRSLRYFVAVAEELHFTRAAARVMVAQQSLSRDIQRLERRLGLTLLVRSTRRVTLTPEGERLLVSARELLALHDGLLRDLGARDRALIVDLLTEAPRFGVRVIDAALGAIPGLEIRRRYGQGMTAALRRLGSGEIDVAFGRVGGTRRQALTGLEHHVLRYEPIGLLLPEGHPLARRDPIAARELRGQEIDAGLGNPEASEWNDFATQVLASWEATSTPPHPRAEGLEDEAEHLARQGLPILTSVDRASVARGVVRAVVAPSPLYPWSIVVRRKGHPATAEFIAVAERLSQRSQWLDLPDDAWLPEPEATELG